MLCLVFASPFKLFCEKVKSLYNGKRCFSSIACSARNKASQSTEMLPHNSSGKYFSFEGKKNEFSSAGE